MAVGLWEVFRRSWRWALLTDALHCHSGVDVLVVLSEADAVHVVGRWVADDVCQSSARGENSVRGGGGGADVCRLL